MPNASNETLEVARIKVARLADMLAVHGYFCGIGVSKDDASKLLSRFLSLKHDRGIGYRVRTGFEVLNAIWQSHSGNRRDLPMYLAAARTWKIALSEKQADTLRSWRLEIKRSIEAGEAIYLRDPINDSLLKLLFPDLRENLDKTTGQALQNMLRPRASLPAPRDGFLSGPELNRWLKDHPESAPMWRHLKR